MLSQSFLLMFSAAVSALVIFWNVAGVAAHVGPEEHGRGMICFSLFALGAALMLAGTVITLSGNPIGGPFVLIGVAIRIITDRRKHGC